MTVLEEEKPDFVRDVEARQSNILFPDTLRNGLTYNYFLWNGAPDATLVQRIGLVVASLAPFVISLTFVVTTAGASAARFSGLGFAFGAFFSLPTTYIAARLIRNAFRRK